MAKIIILAVFSQYLGASIPLIGIALYFIQRFYLQTSRQVRLLGIEARAPLYTHFTEVSLFRFHCSCTQKQLLAGFAVKLFHTMSIASEMSQGGLRNLSMYRQYSKDN